MGSSARMYPSARQRSIPDVPGLGGAISGFLAGLVMVLLSPLLSLLTGISIWVPPRLIAAAAPWYGRAVAEAPGFELGPVLTGTLLHFITSIILGAIFGFVFHRILRLPTSFGTPILVGLAYGILIFVVAYALVLPAVNPVLREAYLAPFVAQNMVFGICVGLFYAWVRPRQVWQRG
jgi:membrane associated rhomboid family serine protease